MNDAGVALSVVDPGPPPGEPGGGGRTPVATILNCLPPCGGRARVGNETAVYVARHAHVLQTGLSACFHGGTHNGARGERDMAMQAIHTQRDLAGLSEPRFINAPPDWLRPPPSKRIVTESLVR